MSQIRNMFNNVETSSAGRAGAGIDIEHVVERYGLNLSAVLVLMVIEKLVYASRRNGTVDRRGVPYCFAGKEYIAHEIGKSVRTVARAIHDLKAAGLIECRRTRANARLFITGYDIYGAIGTEQAGEAEASASADGAPCHAPETATNGTSCGAETMPETDNGTSRSDENGTSNITPESINNNQVLNQSINQSHEAGKGKTDGKDRARTDAERERFEAEKLRISEVLRGRLMDTGAADDAMAGPCEMLIRYITDAVAAKRDVRVNGVNVSADQYWDVIRLVKGGQRLRGTLEEIAARDRLGMIKNRRAYLLASVYNCAIWDRMDTIEPDVGKVERLKNPDSESDGGRRWKNPALDYAQREWREEDYDDLFMFSPGWCARNPEMAREYGYDEHGNHIGEGEASA